MDDPVLLLLHGLGATGDVWEGVVGALEGTWSGEILAPDLPGHAAAPPLEHYTFDALAASVAAGLDPTATYVVLGHSLGGVVGLALAGPASGVTVARVVGLGIKVAWSDEDLGRAAALAAKPPAVFPRREQALDRHLAVSGLRGLVPPEAPAAVRGVREIDGGWRLALDPRAFGVGAPDLAALIAAADAGVLLARGEHDPMVSDADLAATGVPTRSLPGLGHSAHVEDPAAVAALLESPA